MKIEGEYVFKGPHLDVWEMFTDPTVLASALPGTQDFKKISDTRCEVGMFVRVGSVSGVFSGNLEVSGVIEPESCTLIAEGKGEPGFAECTGNVNFTDIGDGTTLLKYIGEVQIGGKIASVDQSLIDNFSKGMIRQGFESLDKTLEIRLAAKSGQKIDFNTPAENEFVKETAKKWLQIAEVRMVLYVVPVALLLALFAFIISKLQGH